MDRSRTIRSGSNGRGRVSDTDAHVCEIVPAGINAGGVKALAHITGGGLSENLPRVLPEGTAVRLDGASWPGLPVFKWLKEAGDVEETEMFRAFNTSIGMALIIAPSHLEQVSAALRDAGEDVYLIGVIEDHSEGPQVIIENGDQQWRG